MRFDSVPAHLLGDAIRVLEASAVVVEGQVRDLEDELKDRATERDEIHAALDSLKRRLAEYENRQASAPPRLPGNVTLKKDARGPRRGPIQKMGDRPPTRVSVRNFLRENEGTPFSVQELLDALLARDLLPPDLSQPRNTVLEAAKRAMADDARIERMTLEGLAHFVYLPKRTPTPEGGGGGC